MKNKEYWSRNHGVKIKGILGMVFIILAIAGIFLWETYGREALTYTEIVVFNQDVQANQKVSPDLLATMKVPTSQLISRVVLNSEEILGKETTCYLPRGLQLSEKFFQDEEMTTGNGRYVFAVPTEWLYFYPQTLRRGDSVFFYAVPASDGECFESANSTAAAVSTLPDDRNTAILKTRVAYVKDNTNREVIDVTPDRLDGSAAVSKIEVYINDEQYQLLKSNYEAGYQFVILYE